MALLDRSFFARLQRDGYQASELMPPRPQMSEAEWDDRARLGTLPYVWGFPDFFRLDDTDATRDAAGRTLRERKQEEYDDYVDQQEH